MTITRGRTKRERKHNSPACSGYPKFSAASPFLDYASFVWAARLSEPDTTVSFLVPRRDRARSQPLIPAPRRDIAKPLASCRSETQRTARSQDGCLVVRFLLSKNIDRETRALQRIGLLYPSCHKNRCFQKEGTPYDANKRTMGVRAGPGAAALPEIARSAASFNQASRKISGRKLHRTKHRDPP